MHELKDKILDLDIVDVLSKYITLKRAGANYKANCPIHKEKTPSLMVSPGKNMWKCFGCGKGGNAIDFVIENEGLDFVEAMKKIAREHNIEIPEFKPKTDEDRKKEKHREALLKVNQIVAGWFKSQLLANKKAMDYVAGRWKEESIKLWDIGYAPAGWSGLIDFAKINGIKKEILLEAGLIKEGKKGLYDFFRDRIIFPIHDKYGRIIGFSGRDFSGDKDQAKYINTRETDIFTKGNNLFGLHQALKKMRDKKQAYLVEGNPDVIRLQEIDIDNTVAPLGTSLTPEQVQILKKYCTSINIIGDSDNAGRKAVDRSAKMIIKEGIAVNVVTLPDGEDPDTFFKDNKQFKDFVKGENITDYILLKANEWKGKANNPDFKMKAVDELSGLVVSFEDPVLHEFYIDRLGDIIKPKKAWTDKLKYLQKEKAPKDTGDRIPDHVSLSDFERYGFYEDHNCYYFRTNKGIHPGSNFIMKPLFHIKSTINAKRLYIIKNEHGEEEVIEFAQRDLIGLARFKEKIESVGTYLWDGSESELSRLKKFLYEKTKTCIEITQLGWNKAGFFAWGNGIYNGQFTNVDKNGIVTHKEENYYIPAFSSIYRNDENLYQSERKFIHRPEGSISLEEYFKKLYTVFGDNAIYASFFYIATLFRDIIINKTSYFPILNLFGPIKTGKTELALSLLQFFGKQGKGPNIQNTTIAGLSDHISQVSNACVNIDEYKNNIDVVKIEFLKGIWDGTGRSRMNMDKDKKKETTAVDCGVILSGQEMPTADNALFTRVVYLSFPKSEFTNQEQDRFNELKSIQSKGLTHITHEILSYREYFQKHWYENFEKIGRELNKILGDSVPQDRVFNNWLLIVSAYATLKDKIKLPFNYNQVIKNTAKKIKDHQMDTKKSGEINIFWNIVQYLYADGLIQEDVDFKIDHMQHRLRTDLVDVVWDEPRDIIYLQHSRVIPLYRKHARIMGEKPLPTDSIDYYLRNDKHFFGKKRVAFKYIDARTGQEQFIGETGKKKRTITNAYVFDYAELDITLTTGHDENEEEENIYDQLTEEENEKEPRIF